MSLCVCVLSVLQVKLCVFMFLCVFYEVVCKSRPLLDVSFSFRQRSPFRNPGRVLSPNRARSVSFVSLFLSLCVFCLFYFKLCVRMFLCVYEVCNSPYSYRQPGGRGQLLSRRYCTHSVWLFRCAFRTAQKSHGALAVSRKYFKQSNWPDSAAYVHANSQN